MGDRRARDSGDRYSLLQTVAVLEIFTRDIAGEYLGGDQ